MNTKVLEKLGKNIKRYRKENGLTQDELVAKTGRHQTYIGKLESGKINPSVLKLFLISRALKIKLSSLFDFD